MNHPSLSVSSCVIRYLLHGYSSSLSITLKKMSQTHPRPRLKYPNSFLSHSHNHKLSQAKVNQVKMFVELFGIVVFVAYSYWDVIGALIGSVFGVVSDTIGAYSSQLMPVVMALGFIAFLKMMQALAEAEANRLPETARVQHIFVKSFSRA